MIKVNKEKIEFMKAVYRNWAYYGATAREQAEAINKLMEVKK